MPEFMTASNSDADTRMNERQSLEQRVAFLESLLRKKEAAEAALRVTEQRAAHVKQVLRAIRRVNQLIVHETDRHGLIEGACRTLTETMGYFSAWILLLEEESGKPVMTASCGFDHAFTLMQQRLDRQDWPECLRYLWKNSEHLSVRKPETECGNCPLANSYTGTAGFVRALNFNGRIYGFLGVSVPAAYADDDEEKSLFNEVAGDLAFALSRLEETEALQQSHRFIQTVLDHLPMGIAVNSVSPAVKFTYMNDRFVEYYRVSREALTNPNAFWNAVYEDPLFREEIKARVLADCATGDPEKMRWVDVPLVRKGQKSTYITAQNIPLPELHLVISTVVDTTRRKKLEFERDLTAGILARLNQSADLHEAVHGVTAILKNWLGCEAVGIRLQQGDDYPYFETHGFPPEFVEKERNLCAKASDGSCLCDAEGRAILECMCGNVIRGRFNPALSFFTSFGSFWTNSTTDLLASTTEADRQAYTRNRCNSAGYESVALIPLKVSNRILGLLQCNDKRRGRFNLEEIAVLERLSASIALALDQRLSEQALRKSESLQRTLIRSIPDMVWFKDPCGVFLSCNQVFEDFLGRCEAEIIGKTDYEFMEKERADFYRACDRAAMEEDHYHVNEEWLTFAATGYVGKFETIETAIRNAAGEVIGVLGIARDITRHKQAEAALRESEERFRAISEYSHNAICIVDETSRIIWMNGRMEAISGYTLEQALGAPSFVSFLAPESVASVEENFKKFVAGEPYEHHYLFHFIRADGEKRLAEKHMTDFTDTNGHRNLLISMLDVTEQKRSQDELQNRDNILQKIFDLLPIGLWFADRNGILLKGNRAGVAIWGAEPHVSPADYGIFKARRLTTGKEIAPADWALAHSIKSRVTVVDELLEIEAFDGQKKIILNYTAPVLDNNGNLQGAIVVNQDITRRWQTEEALRESEERWKSYVEYAPYGIFITDENTRYLQVNPEASRTTGYSKEELLTMSITDLLVPESRAEGLASFRQLKDRGRAYIEVRFSTKTGEIRWWSVAGVKLSDTRYLGFTNDITARKKAEDNQQHLQEQLLQAQKMESVGRLAGGVAHDFNNMLQTILGHADFLLEDCGPDSPLRDSILEINQAALRSADLTRQLLAFARKQTIAPKIMDINEVVPGMLKMLRRLLGEDIELIWKPGDGKAKVNMDPSQLDQILVNLSVNARDAIRGVGRLTIETKTLSLEKDECTHHAGFLPGKYVMIAISDDGCGMDRDILEHLFEPFFTTKSVGKGTGLGLSTVYGIVKQNSGFIYVYSEPGEGSTFRIYLPWFMEQSEAQKEEPCFRRSKGGHETILIVEDEAPIAETIHRFLTSLGYQVLVADSSDKALQMTGDFAGEIHLAITDVIMPGMSGKDMIAHLLEKRPFLKTLYMSGYTADVIAHRGVLDADVHFLAKPFSRDDLADKVRAILDS